MTTLSQLTDAATAVLDRNKKTALAELFSVELNFTIDTLKEWFNRIIKPKFCELDSLEKLHFRRQNPINDTSVCCIYDFPLSVDTESGLVWFPCRMQIFMFKKQLLVW